MTPIAQAAPTPAPAHSRSGSFVGTWTLVRFMLRRDRLRLPLWVLGLTLVLAYFANALGTILDENALASFAAFATNPVMALVGGPGYGFDAITTGKVIVGLYGVYLMIGAALMNILTLTRHTHLEEQTGRAESVRANVVGTNTYLAAVLIVIVFMNALMVALMALSFWFSPAAPDEFASAVLFACSIGAVGLVFAGVSAITAQLSPSARAASGMAGAVLGIAFVVRGLGDMSFVQGGNLGWLSWLSPFGWSQQTAPNTLDRWWPLAISLVATAALVWIAFTLHARRDLGAGVFPERRGTRQAPTWLNNPFALAFRLQRSGLLWWSAALVVSGAIFGAFVKPLADNSSGLPAEILGVLGGAAGIVDGYLKFMGIYFAIIVEVFAINSIQALRNEETTERTQAILATGVSRSTWLLAWGVISGVGSSVLLGIAGVGEGIGAALAMGDVALLPRTFLGHLAHSPALWVILAVAVAFYGNAPRLISLTWVIFTWSAVLVLFGEILQASNSLLATSVFTQIGQYPAQDISLPGFGVLCGVAVLLAVIGTIGFKNRDLSGR